MWTTSGLAAVLSLALCSAVYGSQYPFSTDFFARKTSGTGDVTAAFHNGTVVDVNGGMTLANVPEEQFVTLGHEHFPGHQVRIKKSNFCDPTVNVYTGYLDIDDGAKSLFFYYFESRRDPASDDVMMWINGGPGCSSSTGLLMELGPCRIDTTGKNSNGTLFNPYSWNSEANIFFLDQPIGVGFSYSQHGETIETTETAAKNIHAFVSIFFQTFNLAGRPFHLSGESYGGRYLPVFASEIYDQNEIAKKENRTNAIINMKSVLIGNGNTDGAAIFKGKYDIQCGKAALDTPIMPISTCVRMKQAVPRCLEGMRRSCQDTFDDMNCRAAVAFCSAEIEGPYYALGLNPFDLTKLCDGPLCYAEGTYIADYLNRPATRKLLGVTSPHNFTGCSSEVGARFVAHMDKFAHPTQHYVAGLLERGVRVLIYAGTYDWQCNWVSNVIWTEALEWSGAHGYQAAEWRPWSVDGGDAAGQTKEFGGLTFVTLLGAGHMVPFDKPVESLAMVSRWLAEKDM